MPHQLPLPMNRRQALRQCAVGFGSLALADLVSSASDATVGSAGPLIAKASQFPARAKRVIFLFMHGGPSHVYQLLRSPILKSVKLVVY